MWGFFVSTVILYHATFTVNSVCHVFGYRTYDTKDGSMNNWIIAILTLGEGWHNNHHAFPNSERQGHKWYQLDICHYILWSLSKIGIVWDIPVEIRLGDLKAKTNTPKSCGEFVGHPFGMKRVFRPR